MAENEEANRKMKRVAFTFDERSLASLREPIVPIMKAKL